MNKIYGFFCLFFLLLCVSFKAEASTLDPFGRVIINNSIDLDKAIIEFNNNTLPIGVSNPVTFIFMKDIHHGDGNSYPVIKAGITSNKTTLIIDGNFHRYTYGKVGSTGVQGEPGSSTPGTTVRLREFEFDSNTDFTLKNMNIGLAKDKNDFGQADPSLLNYVNGNIEDATESKFAFLFSTGKNNIDLHFSTVNFIAGKNGKFVDLSTNGFNNTLSFSGVNNILYPPKITMTAHNALIQGPPDWTIEDGTTNFVSDIDQNRDAIFYLEPQHNSPNYNQSRILVERDAVFNLTVNRNEDAALYDGNSNFDSVVWDILGEMNFRTPSPGRSSYEALHFEAADIKNFAIDLGESAKFTSSGYIIFDLFNGIDRTFQLNCSQDSYLDWYKQKSSHTNDDGRLFLGNPRNSFLGSLQSTIIIKNAR
ncbi:MAG: hypothetical protein LBD38_02260, partial [Streptococcaceae bacterium]|nr:hypothetical protein [Streptococcaceae bacterium]